MAEGGGFVLSCRTENTELIENPALTKRSNRSKRAELERNWNIAFYSPAEHKIDGCTFLRGVALEIRQKIFPFFQIAFVLSFRRAFVTVSLPEWVGTVGSFEATHVD